MIVSVGNGFHCPECDSAETNVVFDAESGWSFVCDQCGLLGGVEIAVRWQDKGRWFRKTICKMPKERKGRPLTDKEKGEKFDKRKREWLPDEPGGEPQRPRT